MVWVLRGQLVVNRVDIEDEALTKTDEAHSGVASAHPVVSVTK